MFFGLPHIFPSILPLWVVELFPNQVEVKRTVPREDTDYKGVSKTKKIFVGGIPPSLTNGIVVQQKILILL